MPSNARFDANHPIEKDALGIIWASIFSELSEMIGAEASERWFSPLKLTRVDSTEVCFTAPNSIYTIWVEMNYKNDLESVLANVFVNHGKLKFKVDGGSNQADETAVQKMVRASNADNSIEILDQDDQPEFELGLEDKIREKRKNTKQETGKDRQKVQKHHDCPDFDKIRKIGNAVGLKEENYFENFVVGDSNQMAWAAAEAVTKKPGRTYQPLFIYSESGLGKTHLLHAIGWKTLELKPDAKIMLLTAEEFANDYVDSLQNNALVRFRKKYRKVDLLLIDDVQFLASKVGFQEEFFHTFNSLNDSHKQIVLTSDLPPHEIRKLEKRLVTRFQWGLTTEIAAPSEETRAAILRRKRDLWELNVSNEVIDFLASRIKNNVRLLEGALIRCSLAVNISDVTPIDTRKLEPIIADLETENDHERLTPDQIQHVVAEEYGLSHRDLSGRRRTAKIAEARHVAMLLSREMTDYSLVEIGEVFCRDHGTVIHGMNSLRAKMEKSTSIRGTVDKLRRILKRGVSDENPPPRASATDLA